ERRSHVPVAVETPRLGPRQLAGEPVVIDQARPLEVAQGRRDLLRFEARRPEAPLELAAAPPPARQETQGAILRGPARLLRGVAVLGEGPLGADQLLPLSWPAPRRAAWRPAWRPPRARRQRPRGSPPAARRPRRRRPSRPLRGSCARSRPRRRRA